MRFCVLCAWDTAMHRVESACQSDSHTFHWPDYLGSQSDMSADEINLKLKSGNELQSSATAGTQLALPSRTSYCRN
jgi:hypothetical protein